MYSTKSLCIFNEIDGDSTWIQNINQGILKLDYLMD